MTKLSLSVSLLLVLLPIAIAENSAMIVVTRQGNNFSLQNPTPSQATTVAYLVVGFCFFCSLLLLYGYLEELYMAKKKTNEVNMAETVFKGFLNIPLDEERKSMIKAYAGKLRTSEDVIRAVDSLADRGKVSISYDKAHSCYLVSVTGKVKEDEARFCKSVTFRHANLAVAISCHVLEFAEEWAESVQDMLDVNNW